jgi:hypothetical protein
VVAASMTPFFITAMTTGPTYRPTRAGSYLAEHPTQRPIGTVSLLSPIPWLGHVALSSDSLQTIAPARSAKAHDRATPRRALGLICIAPILAIAARYYPSRSGPLP